MKKIAIIAMATALKNEKGYTRFTFLADMLVKRGYEVDLITSSFQHWEKKQRNKENIKREKCLYNVVLVDEPGYKKNIDLNRLFSHYILARNLRKKLLRGKKYDLIYNVIPPNGTAKIAGKYANREKIPFVVDVEDLWPEAMKMVLDIPFLTDIIYFPLRWNAEQVYKMANGIIGTSDEYRDRAFKKRRKNIVNDTVYVGIELKAFDSGVEKYKDKIEKNANEFWVTYAGTLGASYDIKTLISAASLLKKEGYDSIKIKVLGNGPMKEELENMAKLIHCNVDFLGYIEFEKMAAYLYKSDILINSFVKKAPQSIVNKIGDYLAAGKPMINTCSSKEFSEKVVKDGFGINVEAENAVELAKAMKEFFFNKEKCAEMGRNARKIAEKEFDREVSYEKILKMIDGLLKWYI